MCHITLTKTLPPSRISITHQTFCLTLLPPEVRYNKTRINLLHHRPRLYIENSLNRGNS